jgi:hypothetical protein
MTLFHSLTAATDTYRVIVPLRPTAPQSATSRTHCRAASTNAGGSLSVTMARIIRRNREAIRGRRIRRVDREMSECAFTGDAIAGELGRVVECPTSLVRAVECPWELEAAAKCENAI